jgi:hypothetical protein
MKKKAFEQNEQTQSFHFTLDLNRAIAAWEASRQAFQTMAGKEERDAYMRATDKLGQAISVWATEHTVLADQFAMWFDTHKECWGQ